MSTRRTKWRSVPGTIVAFAAVVRSVSWSINAASSARTTWPASVRMDPSASEVVMASTEWAWLSLRSSSRWLPHHHNFILKDILNCYIEYNLDFSVCSSSSTFTQFPLSIVSDSCGVTTHTVLDAALLIWSNEKCIDLGSSQFYLLVRHSTLNALIHPVSPRQIPATELEATERMLQSCKARASNSHLIERGCQFNLTIITREGTSTKLKFSASRLRSKETQCPSTSILRAVWGFSSTEWLIGLRDHKNDRLWLCNSSEWSVLLDCPTLELREREEP